MLNIHYILYFYRIYIMIHDDHNGLKMEKKVSDDSLLDNAPNYLVRYVIQKRKIQLDTSSEVLFAFGYLPTCFLGYHLPNS